jgi:hypothetical protein
LTDVEMDSDSDGRTRTTTAIKRHATAAKKTITVGAKDLVS